MNPSTLSRLLGISAAQPFLRQSLGACATSGAHPPAGAESGPVVKYDMDPIRIDATHGPTGMQIEAYDAPELFERAGVALSDKRFDAAAKLYAKLLKAFRIRPTRGRRYTTWAWPRSAARIGQKPSTPSRG